MYCRATYERINAGKLFRNYSKIKGLIVFVINT